MARDRNIKKEFFWSESLAECSHSARLAFIRLWQDCNDYGVAKFEPRKLRTSAFPFDDMTVSEYLGLLCELEEVGCIRLFVGDGVVYLDVPNFNVYQTISHPSKTNLPNYDSKSTPVVLHEYSMSTPPNKLINELINKGEGGVQEAAPIPFLSWMADYEEVRQ